jgi:ribosome maturation factor RimP
MTGPGWLRVIERTVTGLGYELVEVERAARGLLRVTIDRVPGRAYPARVAGDGGPGGDGIQGAEAGGAAAADRGEFVTVDDCERVTRQLQYALEVDGVPYERLEVSSPGLDRPLKHEADFERFAGQPVSLTLKQPFQGRKHWKGLLVRAPSQTPQGWRLELDAGQGEGRRRGKPGVAASGKAEAAGGEHAAAAGARALDFRLDEVREARLVPVVDFKGRGRQGAGAGESESRGGATGARPDGGLER